MDPPKLKRLPLFSLVIPVFSAACEAAGPPTAPEPAPQATPVASKPHVETEAERMRRLDPLGLLSKDPDADASAGPPVGTEAYLLDDETLAERTFLHGIAALDVDFRGRDLEAFFRRTGIRVIRPLMAIKMGKHSCRAPSDEATLPYLDGILTELSIYPGEALAAANLEFFLLCEDFQAGDIKPGGMAVGPAATVVFDVDKKRANIAGSVHHELQHMIDQADGAWKSEWRTPEAEARRYGRGGRNSRDASPRLGSGGDCFATEYGQSDVNEDRAEIFRMLITRSADFAALSGRSPCLSAKVALLQTQLERFHPSFDPGFWRRR